MILNSILGDFAEATARVNPFKGKGIGPDEEGFQSILKSSSNFDLSKTTYGKSAINGKRRISSPASFLEDEAGRSLGVGGPRLNTKGNWSSNFSKMDSGHSGEGFLNAFRLKSTGERPLAGLRRGGGIGESGLYGKSLLGWHGAIKPATIDYIPAASQVFTYVPLNTSYTVETLNAVDSALDESTSYVIIYTCSGS